MASVGADLLGRMAAGDRDAFADFYDRYAPFAFSLILRVVREHADASDVLQEVFWEVWQAAGAYDPTRGTVEAWIATRARTRAIDRLRSRRRRGEVVSTPLEETVAGPPDGVIEQTEDRGTILSALAQLSEAQRQVIELAYYGGFTQSEIAERTKQPLGTVKTRIRVGLERLREVEANGMSHEMFETLAAGYALDALDGDDLVRFREHLAEGCPTCELMVRDYHEALAALGRQAPPVIPPASVKSTLLARLAVGAAPPAPPARRRQPRWVPWAVGAAMVVTALVTGMLVAGRYEAEIGRLAAETAVLRERVQRDEAALREQLVASARVLELLSDPATRIVTLRGGGPAAQATGRVVWNATGGGHLFVADLPPAPPGKTYELWTITAGMPRPAGLFDVDASGRAGRRLEPVREGGAVDVFAITVEPAGGAPAPTGPIVLASR